MSNTDLNPPSVWDSKPHWKREAAQRPDATNQGFIAPELLTRITALEGERDHYADAWAKANELLSGMHAALAQAHDAIDTLHGNTLQLDARVRELELRNATPAGHSPAPADTQPAPAATPDAKPAT